MKGFKSEKNLIKHMNKSSYESSKKNRLSSNNLNLKQNFQILYTPNAIEEEEEHSQKTLGELSSKLLNSSKITNKINKIHFKKPKKKLSSKEFFKSNYQKKIFNNFQNNKIFHRKVYRKLSHTNTRIFSELIRNSILKRQNEEERFKIIIKCLLHNINNRTNEDLNVIKNFLKENKISKELIFDKSNIQNENLFQALSYEMEYRSFSKLQKICEISEKIDNIYLIIKGRVEVYELVEYKVDMTLYKYIKWIYDFKESIQNTEYKYKAYNLEMYKLKKDLEQNRDIINISFEDIPYLIALIIKYKLSYMIKNNNYNIFSEDLEKIINDCKNDPFIYLQNFEYDKKKRNDYYYIKQIINNLFLKLPIISKELMDKYSILSNNEEHYYSFKRYNLKKVRELKDGDYLGENTLDENGLRKCSVMTLEETHMGCIDYYLYSDIINMYKGKIRDREAKFLKDSFYFRRISLQYFIKYYFNEFTYQELIHGNNILIQNQPIEYLYFLKEGIIELYCNQSIIELIDIIKQLSTKLKNTEEIKNDILNITNKLYFFGKINKNFLIKTTSRLLIISKADILGIESLCTGFPFFYNCKIISDKAKFYKISINKIDKLFKDIKEGKEQIYIDSNKRLNVLCKRLIKIVKTRIEYNHKYNFFKEDVDGIFDEEKKINNIFAKNKKIIINNKIKELLNIKNYKNKEKEKESNKETISTFFHLTFSNINKDKNILFNMTDTINSKSIRNNTEENKFAKTHYFNSRNKDFSYRNLLLKKEKEKIKSNKNVITKLSLNQNIISTSSEKNIFSNDLINGINFNDDNKNIVNKKIYSIKGEIRLLKNLKNILEEELLLSQTARLYKKTESNKDTLTDGEKNNIKKAKTLIIRKNLFDEEFINEDKSRFHSRKLSVNFDPDYFNKKLNLNFSNSNTPSTINVKNKNNNNNININSFIGHKNRLCIGDNSKFHKNNYTQKSIKIFFNNNKNDDYKKIKNYKLKQNRYCLTEREMYKKKMYKIMQKKIKEPNYFFNYIK